MTLKINYLDSQKKALKNKALFVSKESKISDFKGILDDKTNQKILNFLKANVIELIIYLLNELLTNFI